MMRGACFPTSASRSAVRALLLVLLLVGSAEAGSAAARNVEPPEAAALLRDNAANPDFVLLDVRTPGEFSRERLGGAMLIDYRAPGFRQKVADLDRTKSYLVYCRTGNRSTDAVGLMAELGFRNVYHLDGGIERWKSEGLPTQP